MGYSCDDPESKFHLVIILRLDFHLGLYRLFALAAYTASPFVSMLMLRRSPHPSTIWRCT